MSNFLENRYISEVLVDTFNLYALHIAKRIENRYSFSKDTSLKSVTHHWATSKFEGATMNLFIIATIHGAFICLFLDKM